MRRPGSCIVVNTLGIPDWQPHLVERLEPCQSWCEAKLYIVPAKVAGTWTLPQGSLVLEQTFQHVTGTLATGGQSLPIEDGVVKGLQISLKAGGQAYEGRIKSGHIDLTVTSGNGRQRLTARRAE